LLSTGPQARGLDLRAEDDRALLLTFAHKLRTTTHVDRSLFSWLEDNETSRTDAIDVVTAVVEAAVHAVADHVLVPTLARFTLWPDTELWQAQAAGLLDATRACRELLLRVPLSLGDKGSAREFVWTSSVAEGFGYLRGHLTDVGAGRAFARLARSFLAPLGALPLTSLRDGRGTVVMQRLLPDDDDGVVQLGPARAITLGEGALDESLPLAWAHGRALSLPEPKGCPRHDVVHLPEWLAHFLRMS
jgi:hypothetical protein